MREGRDGLVASASGGGECFALLGLISFLSADLYGFPLFRIKQARDFVTCSRFVTKILDTKTLLGLGYRAPSCVLPATALDCRRRRRTHQSDQTPHSQIYPHGRKTRIHIFLSPRGVARPVAPGRAVRQCVAMGVAMVRAGQEAEITTCTRILAPLMSPGANFALAADWSPASGEITLLASFAAAPVPGDILLVVELLRYS